MFKSTNTYVITSEKSGVLLKGGQPLANAKIIRVLTWNGNEEGLREEFFTDDEGMFTLPAHEEVLELHMLNQFVAKTKLYYDTEEDDNKFWFNSKMDQEEDSETGGKVKDFMCDLDNDNVPVFVAGASIPKIMTKCRWNGIEL